LRHLILFAFAAAAAAQDIRVVSEFRRVDAAGQVIAADRGGSPREILSPAVPRNAFSSFRIIITLPPGSDLWLEIGQNPENAVDVTLYEEAAGGALRTVPMPYKAKLPPAVGTTSVWMDMWVKADAIVDRIKIEPQLYTEGRWFTYPMEVRIIDPVVPAVKLAPAAAPADAPADAAVRALLRERFCGDKPVATGAVPPTIWHLTRRNATQDLALVTPEIARATLLKVTGAATVNQWCTAPPASPNGPEWYLRFRDAIYRAASRKPVP
jgi:hypothetical protein